MIRFIRTTKGISKEAIRGEAGFVLHMLGSKTPKTLDEMIESCRAHNEILTKEVIAYSLLRLIEFGIVGIERR